MPTNLVKTRRQERLWDRAKAIVRGEYHLAPRGRRKRRFYKLAVGIFEREEGKRGRRKR